MKGICTFLLFIIMSSLVTAQEDLLTTFRAVQVDNGIKLTFTIRAGNQCNDLQIQRSDNDLVFEEIGIIPGICGSTSNNETYEFTDTLPLINKEAYYRLNLRNAGYSFSIKTKYINYNENGILIFPNPFTTETNIYIKNDKNAEYIIYLYDASGKIILRESSNSQSITLNRNGMSTGSYFYKLVSDDKVKGNGTLIIN